MIVAIHQPSYWPWLGLIDKIAKADIFIILDTVEVKRQSFQYRNIFYCNGTGKFLTVPIHRNSRTRIDRLRFKNDTWMQDHLNKLSAYYKKAPFFKEIISGIEWLYHDTFDRPVDFIVQTMIESLKLFDINTMIRLSSELDPQQRKGQLMLELSQKVSADVYLSGKGAAAYMENVAGEFTKAGIKIIHQDFNHPVYRQNSNYPFVEGLAGLDLLFFQGIANSRKLLQG
jgi:hypothetical protein